MTLLFTLRCPFDVAKFDDFAPGNTYKSRTFSALGKDVPVSFALAVGRNDTREEYADFLGVYLKYIDGPKDAVVVNFELFVLSDTGSYSLGELLNYRFFRGGGGYGFAGRLPRSVETLAARGYLKSNNTLLEIQAKVQIPEEAFENPGGDRQVFYEPESDQVDPYRSSLFRQLSTPAITNERSSERFELAAKDGRSFWVHKNMLAFSSDVFRGWFDPNKPLDAQSECFKKGVLNMDLGRDALWHMLHFIYLEETAAGFHKYALEIVETAESYGFKALKRIAERSLMGRLDEMSIESLFECLSTVQAFGLSQLKTATVNKLVEELNDGILPIVDDVQDEQVTLLNMIDFAHQHQLTALKQACDSKLVGLLTLDVDSDEFWDKVSDARHYSLDELSKWCAKWLARNYRNFKESGELDEFINHQTQEGRGRVEFLIETFCDLTVEQERA